MERIRRFNYDIFSEEERRDFKELNEIDYKLSIPIIYIIISYIIHKLRVKNKEKIEILKKFNEIIQDNDEEKLKELKEFINSNFKIKELNSGKKEN